MHIHDWLHDAVEALKKAEVPTAQLDAELMLSHTLRAPRTYLHAHPEIAISAREREIADSRLTLRLDRVPLAYIIGHKEFYGRRFTVNPSVLIPRPESEAIIDALKQLIPSTEALLGHTKRLVDVGSGSGCLGITAKLEFPELDVTLTDISRHALTVAEKNAKGLQAEVAVLRSDLLQKYVLQPDVILANLPYVDESWKRSPETEHEPAEALFARHGGLGLINKLVAQAGDLLLSNGLLLLEADPQQHEAIRTRTKNYGFSHVMTESYCLVFQKN